MILLDNVEELLRGRRFCIVTVDMQNDSCSSKSPGSRNNDHEFKREAATNLSKFLDIARKANTPVIHVKNVHSEWTDNAVWATRREQSGLLYRSGSWGAEWWEEFPQNWPKPNEYVVVKHRWSGFHGTDLDMVLRSKKFETIILVGVSSSGCVDATARDAFMLGYGVIVLSDCTWAKTRESHESSLKRLNHHHGIVTTSEEVLKTLAPQKSLLTE